MKKYMYIIVTLYSVMMFLGISGMAQANGDTAAATQSIQKRLQRLEDAQTIRALLLKYGRLLDKEDFVGYSKLFAQDGVWEGGIGSAKGPAEIQEMLDKVFGRVPRGQYGGSYHIMSSIMIDVEGDTATSWSRWTWIIEGKDGKPEMQRSGHYEDSLIRENGQWKFKHRLTVTELPTAQKDSEAQIFRKDFRDK